MTDVIGPIVVSTIVFVLTYVGILAERVHRSVVSFVGALVMVCLGTWLSFYSPRQAILSIDANVLALLFGMMLIVGLFRKTGFFEYAAIRVARAAGGSPGRLFLYLGLATSLISMVLDNVTTIILMIPVTLSIADLLDVPATPFLIAEAMLSNIGGVATLIGDPPNILIGSAAGLTFTDFLTHLLPITVLVWLAVEVLLYLLFRPQLRADPGGAERLRALDPRRALVDPKTTRRMLIVLGGTVLLFFIHERIGLGSGTVAMIGAAAALLWLRPDIRPTLEDIHWDVLLFFVGLFVIVGGLEAAGALGVVTSALARLAGHGTVLASLTVLWVSALMSAVVDNVPFTMAMLPILGGLATHGVAIAPLWWALALGVGFGGNATPIGATANVLAISFSERAGSPISTRVWLHRGLPAAFVACVVASFLDILAVRFGFF